MDALYIRFVEGPVQCEVLRLNDRVYYHGNGTRLDVRFMSVPSSSVSIPKVDITPEG